MLEKKRGLNVDVDMEVTSCIGLLLRALPYLNFLELVTATVRNEMKTSDFTVKDLPRETQYTHAIIRVLHSLRFGNVGHVEAGDQGKVDIQFWQGETRSESSTTEITEHRNRFDNRSRPNYQEANKKCLVIIGKLEGVRKHVREVQGGIEVVGLVPNEGHVEYKVCVKEGEGFVEFNIKCDRVAKKLISLNKSPYFEPAQKVQFISPGWVALKQMSSLTYMYLCFMMRTAVGLLQSHLLSF